MHDMVSGGRTICFEVYVRYALKRVNDMVSRICTLWFERYERYSYRCGGGRRKRRQSGCVGEVGA
jgi:hypothetical protein